MVQVVFSRFGQLLSPVLLSPCYERTSKQAVKKHYIGIDWKSTSTSEQSREWLQHESNLSQQSVQ